MRKHRNESSKLNRATQPDPSKSEDPNIKWAKATDESFDGTGMNPYIADEAGQIKMMTPLTTTDLNFIISKQNKQIKEKDNRISSLKNEQFISYRSIQDATRKIKELEETIDEAKKMCDGNLTNENNIWHKLNNH